MLKDWYVMQWLQGYSMTCLCKVETREKCWIHASNLVSGLEGGVRHVWLWRKPHKCKCDLRLLFMIVGTAWDILRLPTGAPNGSFPQNICCSGQVLLPGKFGKINMSLEGKCCSAIHNSGCQRGFGVYNSLYILFAFCLSLLPSLKGWMSPIGHTQLPMDHPPSHLRAEFCPMTTPKLGSNV